MYDENKAIGTTMTQDSMTRRDVLKVGAVAGLAAAMPRMVFASGQDQIKVGLIGCGGRGTGAMIDAINADPATVCWAMGDLFTDRVEGSANNLKNQIGDRFMAGDRQFSGFDAFEKVLATDIDYVILTAPPGFRPQHFPAAIAAGKHVFMEKPVATDAPGIRAMLAAGEEADRKGLKVAAGTQRRHDVAYRDCIQRIHDGAIGEIVSACAYWNQGGLWMVPRGENMSDMEWQCRNWLYFTWISGDHIIEQHIHNYDVCIWAKGEHPVKAVGLAGREVRKDPGYGHIYDHFAVEYSWADDSKLHSYCRQIDGTASNVSERIVGTLGVSNANTRIWGENEWRWEGDRPNPYMLEHRNLIAAIRNNTPLNETKSVTESTLTGIMGRMASYTGQEVTWDQALNSQESLFPKKLEFGPFPVPAVAVPGKTQLV